VLICCLAGNEEPAGAFELDDAAHERNAVGLNVAAHPDGKFGSGKWDGAFIDESEAGDGDIHADGEGIANVGLDEAVGNKHVGLGAVLQW
jgi:hypothetical protein